MHFIMRTVLEVACLLSLIAGNAFEVLVGEGGVEGGSGRPKRGTVFGGGGPGDYVIGPSGGGGSDDVSTGGGAVIGEGGPGRYAGSSGHGAYVNGQPARPGGGGGGAGGSTVVNRFNGSSQSDANLRLTVKPRYLQTDLDTTPDVKVMCTLQDPSWRVVPLGGCQFVFDDKEQIWDFNSGLASPQSTRGKWSGRYHGKGLQHGECGITLTGYTDFDIHMLGCRVRSTVVGSLWIYQKMMISATLAPPMEFHLQPQVALAIAGSSVTFNGVTDDDMWFCGFWLPPSNTVYFNFKKGLASANNSLARYAGNGLRYKQCGITLLDVQPERSGFVSGRVIFPSSDKSSFDFVELIVTTAPEAPPFLTVDIRPLQVLSPGHVLHATCVVQNSRPVANLTWFLGDKVIREDNINEAPLDSKWRWDHDLQTIEQHLEHVVTLSDNGKQLKCKASHVALAFGSQDSTSHVIIVRADVCGLSTLTTSLVHGGTNTQRGAWPWLAALYENEDNSFFCGGSLISSKHVLTAAHCVQNINNTYTKEQIIVVLGKFELSKSFERYTEPRNVRRLHIHNSYQMHHTSLFDIALLELDDNVLYTRYIQPICLWTSNPISSHDKSTGTVVGWGQTEYDTIIANTPKEVKVGIVSLDTCHESFPLLRLYTNNHTLCAGFKNGTGPCTGDSGGPLMVSRPLGNGVKQWYLRGIVSTAIRLNETCNLQQYVVYTDVSKFSSWLSELMT